MNSEAKKEPKNKTKRLVAEFSILFAAIAVVVVAAFVVPSFTAKKALKNTVSAFENVDVLDVVQVFDPMYRDGDFYGDITADVSADDARSIAERIVSIAEDAKYKANSESLVGNWDLSVVIHKADGSVKRVYFTDTGFYVATETVQYIFEASEEKSDELASLITELEERIAEKRSSEA